MRIKDIEEIQDLCVNVVKVGEVVRFVDLAGSYGDANEDAIAIAERALDGYLIELKDKLDSLAVLKD